MIKISKDIIDVDFKIDDSISQKYHDIEYTSKLLNVKQEQIIFWCNKFKDILKIDFIGQYLIFDDNDLDNLKAIKKMNIDDNMDIKSIKKYLQNNTNIITPKKKTLNEVALISILAKIIDQQNKKINAITTSHNKIMKSNKQIIENQQKFINMFTKLCQDQSDNKELLVQIQESLLKEKEKDNNKIKNIDLKLDAVKSEIATDIEKQTKNLKKIDEQKQLELSEKLEELLKTTTRIEKRKEKDKYKKEHNFWNRIFRKNKSDNNSDE